MLSFVEFVAVEQCEKEFECSVRAIMWSQINKMNAVQCWLPFFFIDKNIAYMQINKCTHTLHTVYMWVCMFYVLMHIYCKHTYRSKVWALLLFLMFLKEVSYAPILHLTDQKYRQKESYFEILLQFKIMVFYFNVL